MTDFPKTDPCRHCGNPITKFSKGLSWVHVPNGKGRSYLTQCQNTITIASPAQGAATITHETPVFNFTLHCTQCGKPAGIDGTKNNRCTCQHSFILQVPTGTAFTYQEHKT